MMQNDVKTIITRIAPSPTGTFHIGTARTALYNYLYAKKNNGKFILRLEDTDTERSDSRYEREIIDSLLWLGLTPDNTFRQSQRRVIYKEHIEKLIESGNAYISKEPSKKDTNEIIPLVRFKNTNPTVSFFDTLRGEITMDISHLGDFVIARGIDDPLYNLAVVIDDMTMGVTSVLRGDDHIANTPRQIALFNAFRSDLPSFTHIPLIHSPYGGKLSKRKDSTALMEYKRRGFSAEALVNFMALLGWAPKGDQEIFTLEQLIKEFDITRIQKREAVFNEQKLLWFQKQHTHRLPLATVKQKVLNALKQKFSIRSKLAPLFRSFNKAVVALSEQVREQGLPFQEVHSMITAGEYDFYFQQPTYEVDLLFPKKGENVSMETIRESLQQTNELLTHLSDWTENGIKDSLTKHPSIENKSLIFWPLRVALSGKKQSPDPVAIATVIGKQETKRRIHQALINLSSHKV